MESLYFLIPLSLVTLGVAIALFFWAVDSGQYDDMEREGDRILFDDDAGEEKPEPSGPEGAEEEKRND